MPFVRVCRDHFGQGLGSNHWASLIMSFLNEEAIDRIIAIGRTKNELSGRQPDTSDKRDPFIQQVAAALGRPYPPPSLKPAIDKVRLKMDLQAVANALHNRTAHRRLPSECQMRTKLRRLAKMAASLHKELVAVERESWLRIDLECRAEAYAREKAEYPELPAHPIEFREGVVGRNFRGAEALASALIGTRRLHAWLDRAGPRPELEFRWRKTFEDRHEGVAHWLFGHVIPDLYERYFGQEAGVSRPKYGGRPEGPYVRFALAVAEEIGARKTNGGSYGAESIAKALRCPGGCPGYDQREWEIWKPPASE
jgi:hypothetical protein